MKTDNYTKIVLTVIAVCLLCIAGKEMNLVSEARAGSNGDFAVVPLNEDGSMNVRVVDMPEKVSVHIESCGMSAFMNAEPIEVKVRN